MKIIYKFMAVKINYINNTSNKLSANIILFSDDKYKINNLKKHLSESGFYYINDLIKNKRFKKKSFSL